MKIIETLRSLGYGFHIEGGTIRYKCAHAEAPAQAATLLAELKRRKAEALIYLSLSWPAESAEAEEKFGQGPARLYPFLNKTVATPHSAGRLWQVGCKRIGVVFPHDPDKVAFMPWYEARPAVNHNGGRRS